MNMNAKLKTMNKNAIQVKIRKLDDELTRLTKALGEQSIRYNYEGGNYPAIVSREYGRWYRETMDPKERSNKIKNLEEKLRNMHPEPNNKLGRFTKNRGRLELNRTKLIIERNILHKALEMRKKHLSPNKPARNKFRSIVEKKVLPPIIENINIVPMGRKTLSPMRRFPGFKEPTLEEYAREKRKVDRLESERKKLLSNIKTLQNDLAALRNKKSNNNNGSTSPKTHQGSPKRARLA
jgi:Skp family chaperone for outer membrane proteins